MPLGICMSRPRSWTGSRDRTPSHLRRQPRLHRRRPRDHGRHRARRHRRTQRSVGRQIARPPPRTWIAKHSIVGDVRGRGLMIGLEIVKDQKSARRAGPMRDKIVELAFERGLLILGCGETSIRLARRSSSSRTKPTSRSTSSKSASLSQHNNPLHKRERAATIMVAARFVLPYRVVRRTVCPSTESGETRRGCCSCSSVSQTAWPCKERYSLPR